jgi:hypothetical protein
MLSEDKFSYIPEDFTGSGLMLAPKILAGSPQLDR